jgi:hypothetical protein
MTLLVILGSLVLGIGFLLVGWQLDNRSEMARQRDFHNRS